jgi:hypothetical protein
MADVEKIQCANIILFGQVFIDLEATQAVAISRPGACQKFVNAKRLGSSARTVGSSIFTALLRSVLASGDEQTVRGRRGLVVGCGLRRV